MKPIKMIYVVTNYGFPVTTATTKKMAELRIQAMKLELKKTAKLLGQEYEDKTKYEIFEIPLWTSSYKTMLENKIKEAE